MLLSPSPEFPPEPAAPCVVVGLVTYNSTGDLPACAAGLAAQAALLAAEGLALRVVVADNASHDGSADRAARLFPGALVFATGANLGYGRAHNRIVGEAAARGWLAPGGFYLPLNPDVRLEPGYIARLVCALREQPGENGRASGWAVGKLLQIDADGNPTGRFYSAGQGVRRDGYPINIGEGMRDTGQFDQPREVMLCTGAAPLLTFALIDAVSDRAPDAPARELFDRAMFMYGEDIELGWRARRAGWRCLYVPGAVAYHRGGAPHGPMRAGALVNQYLAIVKNADGRDLVFHNAPRMLIGVLARLVLDPPMGARIAAGLAREIPGAWRKRRPRRISRAELLAWFRWSEAQPTAGLTGWRERLSAYLRRR
jgi:hypothetical protein